jgi:prophage antirepressor-like protein
MSTDDAVFEFNECPIRVRVVAGAPWFRGRDVATALGYARPQNALLDHVNVCDKLVYAHNYDDTNSKVDGPETGPSDYTCGGNENDGRGRYNAPVYINISGVNALVLGSKLAAARAFKHWVTSDVLPAIQRTGKYHQSTDDRGREDHSDAVDPASATNPIDLRAENEKLRVQLAVERATAELRAEVATLRAKPTGVNDPIAIARAVDAFELVSTSASFGAIDKIFFHDRLKNSLAGASTCALLAVDTTPGAAPKTTDRLLVPLSDSVLKVTGRAFARPDYVPLGKLVAAGYRARHGDVAPPKVERFIDGGTRMVNAYGGDDVAWVEDVVRGYYAAPRAIGPSSSRKRGATTTGPPAKRASTTSQVAITCYTRAT